MKKILLASMLSLAFILAGCSSRTNTCNFSGLTPGGTYVILIPSSTTDGSPTTISVVRIASSTGTISYKTSASCSNVVVIAATNSNLALTANPSSVYLPTPPATVTITGQGFDMTYGAPRIEYFDNSGYLIASVYATSVTSDGTSLEASVPELSNVYSGTYQVKVTNKTSSGYYVHTVGSAPIAAWGRDRPDSDGDGWYDNEDCNPYDPYLNYDCSGGCDNDRGIEYYDTLDMVCY